MPRTLHIKSLGRTSYTDAYALQKQLEAQIKTRELPDTLLLVEHPHVITLGRRATHEAVLSSPAQLQSLGVELYESNRGGKATYHGLGQLVAYPIINLSPDREDVHRYIRDLEQVVIRTLQTFHIEGFTIKGLTGVHVKQKNYQGALVEGKIAALGVHIARWTTTHGFAINVNTDLSFFNLITPCEGEPVASMRQMLGGEIPLREVEQALIKAFAEVFEMHIEVGVGT